MKGNLFLKLKDWKKLEWKCWTERRFRFTATIVRNSTRNYKRDDVPAVCMFFSSLFKVESQLIILWRFITTRHTVTLFTCCYYKNIDSRCFKIRAAATRFSVFTLLTGKQQFSGSYQHKLILTLNIQYKEGLRVSPAVELNVSWRWRYRKGQEVTKVVRIQPQRSENDIYLWTTVLDRLAERWRT